MKLRIAAALFALLFAVVPCAASAQASSERDATRERMRSTLTRTGAEIGVTFHQSTKNPYNFAGSMTGLSNVDSLEIVVSVTNSSTVGFRVYPHYRSGYINVGKLRDATGFMRKLLLYNDNNFLFWGADDTGDVFSGYTVTLESGFPDEALSVVLRSIKNTDKYVGELRPFIDGSSGA